MLNSSNLTRFLQSAIETVGQESNEYRSYHWKRTDKIGELPLTAQIVIIFGIIIVSLLGLIPAVGILYGCLRKEHLLREVEELRRQRIEAFLAVNHENAALTNDNNVPKSAWQRWITSISREEAAETLSRLMFLFTWISVEPGFSTAMYNYHNEESASHNIVENDANYLKTCELPKNVSIQKSKDCTLQSGNSNYCAICISHFEDGDQVVQSSRGKRTNRPYDQNGVSEQQNRSLCIHRFHKNCMIEWLLLSREPLCPCCRRFYLDDAKVVEDGLLCIIRGNESNESTTETEQTRSFVSIVTSDERDENLSITATPSNNETHENVNILNN